MLSNLFTGLVSPEAVTNVVNVGAAFLPDWLNPDVFLRDSGLGPWVIALVVGIIFAETGLLLGFFLPGDSMLFTAGMLMATGAIETPLWVAIPAIIIAAIVGNQLGFYIGEKTGPALYSRDDSKVFKREHVVKAHDFLSLIHI